MKILVVLFAVAASVVAHAQERYVDKEVRVKAPLDAVWQAWTTTDGIKSFFAPAFELLGQLPPSALSRIAAPF